MARLPTPGPGPGAGRALLVVVSAVVACVAVQPVAGQPADAPEWVRTEEHGEFPRDRYLLGVGAASRYDAGADAIRKATANSQAAIARQIQSHVRQSITDSVVEVTQGGEHRIDERVVRATEVRTALELNNARVVERWTGERSVYVLSVVDRQRAAERLRRRIQRVERKLRSRLRRIDRLLEQDPLEAFLNLGEARRMDDELSTRYQVLTGVTGDVRLPPRWTARVEELARAVGDRLEVAVTVRRDGSDAGRDVDSQAPFTGLLQQLGWTVRDTRSDPDTSPYSGSDDPSGRKLREAGIRYLLSVEIESKVTDRVEAGDASLIFARAGGRWELRDLEDREVELESGYQFPEATKAADGDDESRARALAVERLLPLMSTDLEERLGRVSRD